MLTDQTIDALQPGKKSRKVADEKGLCLILTPSGSRLWQFRYYFPPRTPGNKAKTISLGRYPEISLDEARERRDAARRDVAHDIDPSLRRKCERICVSNSFEFVAREFISVLRAANISTETPFQVAVDVIRQTLKSSHSRRPRSREAISAETVDTMLRRLESHVFPFIGQRDVQLLRAPDLLEVLRRIESRGTYDLTHRVRSICVTCGHFGGSLRCCRKNRAYFSITCRVSGRPVRSARIPIDSGQLRLGHRYGGKSVASHAI